MKNKNLKSTIGFVKENHTCMQVICKRPITDFNDLVMSIPLNSSIEKSSIIYDRTIPVYIFDRVIVFRRVDINRSEITFRADGVFDDFGTLGDIDCSDLYTFFGKIYYTELDIKEE